MKLGYKNDFQFSPYAIDSYMRPATAAIYSHDCVAYDRASLKHTALSRKHAIQFDIVTYLTVAFSRLHLILRLHSPLPRRATWFGIIEPRGYLAADGQAPRPRPRLPDGRSCTTPAVPAAGVQLHRAPAKLHG